MRFDIGQPLRRPPSLTSLIDVVFLLLIFFMLSTRFSVESQLPLQLEVGAEFEPTNLSLSESAAKRDAAVIRLDADGATWLSGKRVDARELASGLLEALGSQPGKPVVVTPEAAVSVQRVVDAIRYANDAGARVVSLAGAH